MSLASRILDRLGFVPASEVRALASRVASVETRNRTLRSRLNELKSSSGVPINWGQYNYEHNTELQGARGWATADRMEDDPAVWEALTTATMPLQIAHWDFEPASKDRRDVLIANFLRANILRRSNEDFGRSYWMQTSFESQTLPEILRGLPDGFSMIAKSTRDVDGMIVYDRLQWLEPPSVDPHGWILDRMDNLLGVRRTYSDATDTFKYWETLDWNQIALFPWAPRGARYMGRRFTRHMYSAWFGKEFVGKMSLIWAQKIGSPAPLLNYPAEYRNDPQALADALAFAQQLPGTTPTDAYGFFSKSETGAKVEVDFAGANTGEVDRARGLIDGYNSEIGRGISKSGSLGETTQGSRALSEPMQRRENVIPQVVAAWACNIFTHGIANLPGLSQWLVDQNFADVETYPRLVCTKIDKHEGLENLPQLVMAVEKKLLPECEEVSKAVASMFDISIPQERFDEMQKLREEARAMAIEQAKAQVDSNSDDAGDKADEDEEEAALSAMPIMTVSEVSARIAPLMVEAYPGEKPPGKRRGPNVFEDRYLDLAASRTSFETGEKRSTEIMQRMRAAMIEEIVRRIEAGKIDPRNIESQRRSKSRVADSFARELRSALARTAEEGSRHVAEEVKRMKLVQGEAAA